MVSPLIIIPGFIAYRVHENHLLKERMQARLAQDRAELAQAEAGRRAQKNQ
jgi:hypothetical protein